MEAKNENCNSFTDLNKMIKSNVIFKKIFSFLNLNLKLDLIKYNKKIQNKFQIDINYYKKISGKYIKGKRNGKGKEYTLDKKYLIFEGEYLNGKRNGKGKEYYNNGNLKFEGEYLKGKRLRGNEYNEKGKLIYKIDTEKGEEYYYNGKIRFKGQYIKVKYGKDISMEQMEKMNLKLYMEKRMEKEKNIIMKVYQNMKVNI